MSHWTSTCLTFIPNQKSTIKSLDPGSENSFRLMFRFVSIHGHQFTFSISIVVWSVSLFSLILSWIFKFSLFKWSMTSTSGVAFSIVAAFSCIVNCSESHSQLQSIESICGSSASNDNSPCDCSFNSKNSLSPWSFCCLRAVDKHLLTMALAGFVSSERFDTCE